MSFYFLLNNLHFTLEILGALVFLAVSWLAFDAFLLRRDFLTASRGIGFGLLSIFQVLHGFGLASDFVLYLSWVFYLFGLIFVVWNLILERPVPRPKFQAILVIPAAAAFLSYFQGLSTLLLFVIASLTYRQFRLETKKTLRPFWLAFLFLALGSLVLFFSKEEVLNFSWTLGHLLEVLGFLSLAVWVWQYLQLRIREELTLIFVSFALLISTVVTLAFSTILIGQMEGAAKNNLLSNARVMDLAVLRLKEEALAKASFIAQSETLEAAILQNDFPTLEELLTQYLENENLGFLTILDGQGQVMMRAHALNQRGDNLANEEVVKLALQRQRGVTITSSLPEKFSIRAAVPIFSKNEVVGVVLAGFPLDNALVDNLKNITGLEMVIFEGEKVAASTIFQSDGKTRAAGIRVFGAGETLTQRVQILNRPYLASFLPLKNQDGGTVGTLSSMRPSQEILEIANATNRLTLVTVAIIMLLLIIPVYFITKRLSQEVS